MPPPSPPPEFEIALAEFSTLTTEANNLISQIPAMENQIAIGIGNSSFLLDKASFLTHLKNKNSIKTAKTRLANIQKAIKQKEQEMIDCGMEMIQ